MTLLDLCRLLRRYIALVIPLPVVCALACAGYLALSHSDDTTFTAQSRIVVSTHVQEVGGLAQAQGRVYTDEDENIKVTASVDGNTKTVTITAVTSDEDLSLELVNSIADDVLDEAFEFVPNNVEDPFNARAEKAKEAKASEGSSGLKYVLVAFLAGLFLAICIVVVIDLVKRPVKSIEGVQEAIELPVLEKLPITDNGERLLANIRFASKKDELKTICLVPVGEGKAAGEVASILENAIKSESSNARTIIDCQECLSKSMIAAYEARKADAVVLVVAQWEDSLTALESAAAELELADVNLVGAVFAGCTR